MIDITNESGSPSNEEGLVGLATFALDWLRIHPLFGVVDHSRRRGNDGGLPREIHGSSWSDRRPELPDG